ncbi:NEL-type E3 ubiquitin ligase domain-containing protein [Sinorhizobium sp. BJ1]|uniref:NEL-type E3 ubiquitin ligase domain-containing protein n=1 Tax=Sinorhizobium sp. BJ1 TaxID=2035455 RepID=UPI000BE8A577|nr:NEL-type E3 ubiquitin ligase domain-containing protein [Sinorhizobium sp. BJ1]PDT81317.1 E3 ubiquitin--protein ligase [Sinorhizobium sp. BJ1]
MNVQRPGLGAGTPFENSESESSEPVSPAAARWVEASTVAVASAAASQRQVVAPTAEERPGEGPRQEAVSRTRAWREAGDIDEPLDLSSLSLTALSVPLVTGLRRLNVNNNQLTDLPDTLPRTLLELEASGNQLTRLPDLPAGLERLNVENNQLTNLPEPLPAALEWLGAAHNQLTRLPEMIPPELIWLGARDNQLTSVPESLLTQLGRWSIVDLENNPIPHWVQTNLATAMHAAGYAGPQIFLPMGSVELDPRPLHEVVADWLEGDSETVAAWQGFTDEQGARDYAHFLDRLSTTVNYGNDAFRQAVAIDLRQAAARPQLRAQYFEQASGASDTCEDRITLAWNGMQTARLNADVEDGVYDGSLHQLLQHGRVMFRLEALDGIARETVNSLRRTNPDIDEIEVYLAYQTRLRDTLELRHVAPDMRFLNISHVTEDDIARAARSVRELEATGFRDYVATGWQPWERVVKRIAPESHAAMQEQLIDAMGEEFVIRLHQRLAEHGLAGDADAERVLGAEIRNEIAREIKGDLMDTVLRDRGVGL